MPRMHFKRCSRAYTSRLDTIRDERAVHGWIAQVARDVALDCLRRGGRELATGEDTGFVSTRMSIHPLLYDERSLGVLSVLDQGASQHVGLADMNVLSRIATHAGAVLALVQAARETEAAADTPGELAGLARALAAVPTARREAALALLADLARLL